MRSNSSTPRHHSYRYILIPAFELRTANIEQAANIAITLKHQRIAVLVLIRLQLIARMQSSALVQSVACFRVR